MKNIIITGASSGIGYQSVLALAKQDEDLRILAIARREDRLQMLKDEFASVAGGNKELLTLAMDLALNNSESMAQLIKERMKLGAERHVDVLINNAGYLVQKHFMETTDEDWEQTLNVNLMVPVRLVRALFAEFSREPSAHIVNVGSMGGVQGTEKFPGLSAYSVSKGAINILTESLAAEFRDENITVNCINPGAVQTDMLDCAFPGFKAPISDQDFADYVAYFALHANRFMNGQSVDVSFRR